MIELKIENKLVNSLHFYRVFFKKSLWNFYHMEHTLDKYYID